MIHGVINVYKEKGFTSHDVVAKLRGIAGQKKIGHTGTLDPDATGVLPVCFGKATKLCDMLTDKDKTYEAVLLLGVETDTQDITGREMAKCGTSHLKDDDVRKIILSFVGEYEQVPPMYSAVKVDGRKLYELAREGKVIDRKTRQVTIYGIEILEMNLPRVKFKVHCSKGTYIRTLCHDIGAGLGCGGCMEELIRTEAGRFKLDDSICLSEIEKMSEEGTLMKAVVPIDDMFPDYRKVVIGKETESLAYNGNEFSKEAVGAEAGFEGGEHVRLYDEEGHFIAVYSYETEGDRFRIVKMFFDKNSK